MHGRVGLNVAGSSAMLDVTPVVYIVDDDISVRESLEGLIQEAGWRPRVFSSAQDFLAHPRTSGPNCLILDVSLPDLSGLDLQQRIAGERADMPIIFITGYGDVPMTVRAMKAGAVEFLTKPFGDEVLLNAIRGALERSASTQGTTADMQVVQGRYATLSSREREVIRRYYIDDETQSEIAAAFGVSQMQVSRWLTAATQRLRRLVMPT